MSVSVVKRLLYPDTTCTHHEAILCNHIRVYCIASACVLINHMCSACIIDRMHFNMGLSGLLLSYILIYIVLVVEAIEYKHIILSSGKD